MYLIQCIGFGSWKDRRLNRALELFALRNLKFVFLLLQIPFSCVSDVSLYYSNLVKAQPKSGLDFFLCFRDRRVFDSFTETLWPSVSEVTWGTVQIPERRVSNKPILTLSERMNPWEATLWSPAKAGKMELSLSRVFRLKYHIMNCRDVNWCGRRKFILNTDYLSYRILVSNRTSWLFH